ncbi:thiamine pyrophosphate-dependent enzyme [Aliiroseovarius sp. 2305UL8-7]|uniref:thiamine pyrophosphate-dependent enzyme n=1 Tax=Aliiroseovarius conchicola TaxID=3121637 RepID=UPI0035299629
MQNKVKNTMTGADVIVSSLKANGIDTVFGLPGGQLDNLFDAVQRTDGDTKIIRSRHEQGAAYMAFGAARSTGKPTVFSVVPGPGIMNAMGALSTAWAANSPVLSMCGQVASDAIGSGRGYLHELPDQLATMRTMLKHAERIDSPHNAPHMINDALVAMQTGRPGPAHLEMSPDVMGLESGYVPTPATTVPAGPCTAIADIEQAIALLKNSKRPLIYVGGGATHAADQVNTLANLIEAPVTCFRSGRGIVDDRDYHAQVFPAGRRLWKDADVVFAIGTRLKYAQMYWGLDENIKIIRLDIDPKEFGRYAQPAVALHGDAVVTLDALLPALTDEIKTPRPSREEELTKLKTELHAEMTANVGPQMEYLSAIREVLPDDGIFCDEITQVGFTSWFGLPIHRLRGHINCGFQGTLGYGFATALGVKAANPDTPVVSISGDGGFLFTATELATAVEYGINLVCVVFNDNRYSNVYRQQKEWYDGRFIASDLHNPDFVAFARSFGANAERVEGPAQLKAALERGLSAKGPTIIEAVQQKNLPAPWQYILEAPVRGPNAEGA